MTEHPAGWTCELIVARITAYLGNTLPRVESLAVAEHVEACPSCAERLAHHG